MFERQIYVGTIGEIKCILIRRHNFHLAPWPPWGLWLGIPVLEFSDYFKFMESVNILPHD